MTPPEVIVDALKKNDNFIILTHTTPDGDALGSSLALKFLLEKLNKRVEFYVEKPIPLQYEFLPGIENSRDLKDICIDNFNVLILIDCNQIKRVTYNRDILDRIKPFSGLKIIIDHHITEEKHEEGVFKWIEPQKAATGILVYYMIKEFDLEINIDIATNLYTAIIVDTGNFQFDNTSEEVFRIATELVRAGANPSKIYEHSFECWSENRFRLFIKMLNNLDISPPLAISFLSNSDFKDTKTVESDTERFVEFLRVLKEAKITALFREVEPDFVKVSLRSRGEVDVSIIAREFGGGGHKNAAGYRTKGSIDLCKKELIEKLRKYDFL